VRGESGLDTNFVAEDYAFESIPTRDKLEWWNLWETTSKTLPPAVLRGIWTVAEFEEWKEWRDFLDSQD